MLKDPAVRSDGTEVEKLLLSPVPQKSSYLCRFTPELKGRAYLDIGEPEKHSTTTRSEEACQNYSALLAINLGITSPSDPVLLTPRPSEGLLRFKREEQPPRHLSPYAGLVEEPLRGITSVQKRRKICPLPVKVLDAPLLEDDFYLNLVDWSEENVLAVGLCSSVYLWDAETNKVDKLCEIECNNFYMRVSSLCWKPRDHLLAVGGRRGGLYIYDTHTQQRIESIKGRNKRVGVLAWGRLLAAGGKDHQILLYDLAAGTDPVMVLSGHYSEVCGLKWSPDLRQLASGGNDNTAIVWREGRAEEEYRITSHHAAVKALAWSPHQHGLLATGGGTADRHIRFHNVLSHTSQLAIDTGSQVCNLAWSSNVNELVSTHGYSQHAINVWRYPSLTKVATLTGHNNRVLYLALSPDGKTIVTGAGDETLRFWDIFPGPKERPKVTELSPTLLSRCIIR
eukprot:jgi/Botrbrau1/1805/Bobra.146_1s0004.1